MQDYVNDWLREHKHTDDPTYFKLIAPHIVCGDGTKLSVQASDGHYCEPHSHSGPWNAVEVGYVTNADGKPMRPHSFAGGQHPSDGIYGFVPVPRVNKFIHRHGGIKQ